MPEAGCARRSRTGSRPAAACPSPGSGARPTSGRAEDIAAVVLALDDFVAVAVAFDLIDPEDAAVLAAPGQVLLGFEPPAGTESVAADAAARPLGAERRGLGRAPTAASAPSATGTPGTKRDVDDGSDRGAQGPARPHAGRDGPRGGGRHHRGHRAARDGQPRVRAAGRGGDRRPGLEHAGRTATRVAGADSAVGAQPPQQLPVQHAVGAHERRRIRAAARRRRRSPGRRPPRCTTMGAARSHGLAPVSIIASAAPSATSM